MQHLKFYLKSMLISSMLFLFWQYNSAAQQIQIKRSHAISSTSAIQVDNLDATGTLDVVAIMVEFQPDSNRFTSGTGVFGNNGFDGLPYLTNEEDTRIAPLPHNRAYFEAHLEFAKNYYEKSSDGQLTIDYRVLPQVYQLEKKMEAYSPTGETFTNEKLALLVRDAWQKVEENGGFDAAGLDPETTAFVIFHAGVGRDIELTGTTLDITPQDIPSIYLRKQDLSELLNNPSFEGFPMNDGSFRVTNTMILPRTESRRGLDIQDNEFVFPLSISGLVCASIGSHLGLPDLFNTETGEPAIGRFGLMDGAGFFSYNGLLPPEPSAWEKIYLGWQTPFEIDINTPDSIELVASSLDNQNNIARFNLSSSEYFLIENRHRDPDSTGITLTIRQPDGYTTEIQQTFNNENDAFVFQESGFDSLLQAGVIVNADNFDFSLPGGRDIGEDGEEDTEDDRILNGGILIWHIDEALIGDRLQTGGINADRDRRGVDLEEADGAQDIGPGIPGALDNSAAFGSPYDFWWSGNNYRVITQTDEISFYENRFGPDTKPDNNSNSGAKSFFEFYDFSDNRPEASFKVREVESGGLYNPLISAYIDGSNLYTPDNAYWDYFPLELGVWDSPDGELLIIPGSSDIYVFDTSPVRRLETITIESNQQPLFAERLVIAENPILTDGPPGVVNIRGVETVTNTEVSFSWMDIINFGRGFISSQDGTIAYADFTNNAYQITDGAPVTTSPPYPFRSEVNKNGNYVGISGNTATFTGENIPDRSLQGTSRLFAGSIQSNTGNFYYLFEDGTFTIVDPSKEEPFTTIFEEEQAEWPAIVNNGNIYRVNRIENRIEGFNLNGAVLDNMPVYAPTDVQFIGTPLIADITGDNIQDILVVGQDDYSVNIFAYETNGNPIEGFPLYVGGSAGKEIQPIHPAFYENVLYAVSHTGDLRSWEFKEFTSSQWPSRYGKNPYNKVSADIEIDDSQDPGFTVLNNTETYNWPNPASDETNIRFEVAKPGGLVKIRISNLSGRIIFEQEVQTPGGFPEELNISTQNWGSGGYFALVEATVNGKTERKLIKIGVVH